MRSTVPRLSKSALQLYLVFGPQDLPTGQTAIGLIEQAAAGGVTCVQWRDKTARADTSPGTETDTGIQQRVAHVRPLQDCARALGVPFLINDDVALAKALGADGVHLGQDDMPPDQARRELGDKAIIGWSVGTDSERERLRALLKSDPTVLDYIGVGPAFPTGTKADAGQALGPAGIDAVLAGITLPAVAIGGINQENCKMLRVTNAVGIAVVSAIARHSHPTQATKQLFAKMYGKD